MPARIKVDNAAFDPERPDLDLVSGTGITITPADVAGDGARSKATVALSAAALVGTQVAVVADSNVIGGIPVLFKVPVPAGTTGDIDVVMTHKVRVIDAWFVKTNAASGGNGSVTVKNGATAITDALSLNSLGDKGLVRATTIDDAAHEIAAAGTLRITRTRSTTTDETGICYVSAVRVA